MTRLISFAAAAAFIVGGTAPVLAQSASFEAAGFPATLHQAQVTGFADLREQAPAPTHVADGMPVSPHQLAVLSPRRQDGSQQFVQRHDANPNIQR